MGIERFFSSIKKEWKSFKDLYPPYKNNIKGDKLFIDFNSILYSIFPHIKNIDNDEEFERILLSKVNKYIEELYNILNKQLNLIYIAIDGVPSNGKILEQRKRAYGASFQKRLLNEKYKSDKYSWAKAKIKPGTEFMNKLYNSLLKISLDCKIIISSHLVDGEGEMKIMRYIIDNNIKDGIIFSPDSDMIILILLLNNNKPEKFYLLRLDQQLTKKNNNNIVYNYSDTFSVKQIILKYIDDKINYKFTETMKEQIIKEIMYVFVLFGNDFLPPLETIKIKSDKYFLIDCYIYNYIKNGNIMDYNKKWKINITNFIELIKILESHEFMLLKRNYYETLYERFDNNAKSIFFRNINVLYDMIKKLGKNIFTSNFYKNILKNKDKTPDINFGFFKYKAIMYIKWKNLNYLKMTSKELLDNIIYSINNIIKENKDIKTLFLGNVRQNYYFKYYQDKKYYTSSHYRHYNNIKKLSEKNKIMYLIENRLDEYYDIFSIKDPFYSKKFYRIHESNYITEYNKYINKNILKEYMNGLGWVFNYYLNKSTDNTFAYYGKRSPLLYHILKNIHEDYFIEKHNYIKRSPLEHLILITPNPTIISNFRKLTIDEKNKIKKYLKKYPNFFPDIYKIPIKKLNISCISSIYINKCHYDFLEENIPTLNI